MAEGHDIKNMYDEEIKSTFQLNTVTVLTLDMNQHTAGVVPAATNGYNNKRGRL